MGWSGRERWWDARESVNQRTEHPQPHLLDQTSILFNHFEGIRIVWFRATIVSLKVCDEVNAHQPIQAEGSGSCGTGPPTNAVNIIFSPSCDFTAITKLTNAKRANYNFEAALQFELKTFWKRRLELHSLASSECENHLIKVWILRLLGDRLHLNHKWSMRVYLDFLQAIDLPQGLCTTRTG